MKNILLLLVLTFTLVAQAQQQQKSTVVYQNETYDIYSTYILDSGDVWLESKKDNRLVIFLFHEDSAQMYDFSTQLWTQISLTDVLYTKSSTKYSDEQKQIIQRAKNMELKNCYTQQDLELIIWGEIQE